MTITTLDTPLTTEQNQRAAALAIAGNVLAGAPMTPPVVKDVLIDDLLDVALFILDGIEEETTSTADSHTINFSLYPTSADLTSLFFGAVGTPAEEIVDAEVEEDEDEDAQPYEGDYLSPEQGAALPIGSVVEDADEDYWWRLDGGWSAWDEAIEGARPEHLALFSTLDGPWAYAPVTLVERGTGPVPVPVPAEEYTYVDTLEGLEALEAGERIEFTINTAGREVSGSLTVERHAGGLLFVDSEGKAWTADEVWSLTLKPYVDGHRARVVRA